MAANRRAVNVGLRPRREYEHRDRAGLSNDLEVGRPLTPNPRLEEPRAIGSAIGSAPQKASPVF